MNYTSAKPYFYGTGRRKFSIARVRLVPGSGDISINGRNIDDYFGIETLKMIVRQPFAVTGTEGKFDIIRQGRRHQRSGRRHQTRRCTRSPSGKRRIPSYSQKSRSPYP